MQIVTASIVVSFCKTGQLIGSCRLGAVATQSRSPGIEVAKNKGERSVYVNRSDQLLTPTAAAAQRGWYVAGSAYELHNIFGSRGILLGRGMALSISVVLIAF